MKNFEVVFFIPIKKNSQRVPGKNFRKLSGVPLYKNLLYKLKGRNVYVDTDSDEIFYEIKNDNCLSNINVFFREESLVGDKTSVCDLIKSFIEKKSIPDSTYICQLHVTSPFLKIETIDSSISILKSKKYDSIVSCSTIQSRLWREESYGYCPINHNPIKLEQTQDLPKIFEENSLFYIFNSGFFKKMNSRIGEFPYFYECDKIESIDIDTEKDWKFASIISEVISKL